MLARHRHDSHACSTARLALQSARGTRTSPLSVVVNTGSFAGASACSACCERQTARVPPVRCNAPANEASLHANLWNPGHHVNHRRARHSDAVDVDADLTALREARGDSTRAASSVNNGEVTPPHANHSELRTNRATYAQHHRRAAYQAFRNRSQHWTFLAARVSRATGEIRHHRVSTLD
jgi:hypothetical protein